MSDTNRVAIRAVKDRTRERIRRQGCVNVTGGTAPPYDMESGTRRRGRLRYGRGGGERGIRWSAVHNMEGVIPCYPKTLAAQNVIDDDSVALIRDGESRTSHRGNLRGYFVILPKDSGLERVEKGTL